MESDKRIFGIEIKGAYEKFQTDKKKNKQIENKTVDQVIDEIKLTPIERTAVHVKTEKEYHVLMEIYELGNWNFMGGYSTTRTNIWHGNEDLCISAGIWYDNGYMPVNQPRIIEYSNKKNYQKKNWRIMTPEQFYKEQKVSPKIIKQITKKLKKKWQEKYSMWT